MERDSAPAWRPSLYVSGCWLGLLLGGASPALTGAADLEPQRLIPQNALELRGWSRFVAVTALASDPAGDMWLGSSRGVLRFDGARLESIPLWSGPDTTVADLVFAQGRLHVLTRRGRLLEWSGEAWIPRAQGPFRELGTDPAGNLLVAGGRTLLRLDGHGVLDVHPAVRGRDGWAMDLKLRQGRVWLLWGPDLDALSVSSIRPDEVLHRESGFDFAPDPKQLRRFEVLDDGTRALWAGGLRMRTATGVHALPAGAPVENDRREWVNRMVFADDGALLLCGASGLLRWSAPDSVEVETPALPHPLCLDLTADASGAIWAGTYNGPARFSQGLMWQRWLNPGDPKHGQAQMLIPAGPDYWVAARNGLHRFAPDGRRVEFRERPGGFMAVAQTADGRLYASAGNELYVWQGSDWLRVRLEDDDAVIRGLQADPDGALWVLRSEALERLESMRRVAALPVRTPSMLTVMRDGRRMLAADALYELAADATGWRLIERARPQRPTVTLRSLFEDADGALWIATLGEGLWRWHDDRMQRFGSAQGLPADRYAWVAVAGQGSDAVVYAAPRVADYVDDAGLIAFPHQTGEGTAVPWRQLGRREGLIGAPAYNDSAPSVQVDRSDQLWIAAAEGLAILRHQPWSAWSAIATPQVTIRQAGTHIEGEPEGRARLRRELPTRLEVRLRDLPDARLTLWYRLGDGAWQASSLPTRVELGVLSPGLHHVELQARRAEGLASPIRALALEVPRHWYEQFVLQVMMALITLVAVMVALLLLRQRWRERRRRQDELREELVVLSRFQRLVLACVLQGRGNRERIVAEIGAHLQALDLDAWIEQTLSTLEARGFLVTDAGGQWRVAEPELRGLPLAREPLGEQLRANRVVDRFRLLEPIGEGGQGEVHRAIDSTGTVVALKLLRTEALVDRELRERLRREAKVLAALEHPGVVRLYAHGPYGADDYFLAMELIPGSTLATALARHGRYAEAPARELLHRLREALAAIHASGIVHRDVKPQNLMLRSPTEPVLIDFGLARDLARVTEITEFGQLGTVQYMAPEQGMSGLEPIGPAADWWAFGVVAHELLLGYLPWDFAGLDANEQRLALLHPDGARRRAYPASLSAPWRALIDSCLERDPICRQPDFRVLE